MAGFARRGSGGGEHGAELFMQAMVAGLGIAGGGMSSEAVEAMKRVIASSDCNRSRAMVCFLPGCFAKYVTEEMFENMNVKKSEERERVGPLHDAARKGNMDSCMHLVERLGFDVNSAATDGSGMTPLSCAVSGGKAVVVRYFLGKGADPNKQDSIGFAPLHYAAKEGFEGMARLLLSRGACVDLYSSEGTPLHVAASCGKCGVVQILLEHHADPDMVSPDECVPLTASLCATTGGITNETACLKCMKLLVKAGADLNSTNPDTPLVIATSKGFTECVAYLLEAGADANIPIKHDGSTPIEIAAKSGTRKLVEILFPFTNPIEDVSNWSVEGVIIHAKSGPSKGKAKASVEARKAELKLLGGKAVARKDYAGASKFYREAIELDPADETLYSNQSFCHLKIGEAEDALAYANDCLRLKPEWQKGYYRKGSALMSLKEYKEACDVFMAGLELDPSNVDMQDAYWEAAEAMRKHSAERNSSSLD
ncbi:hypothetical protein ACP4OV_007745 [Aristida adscensionis]